MIGSLRSLAHFAFSLMLAVAMVVSIPLSAINENSVDAAQQNAFSSRPFVIEEQEEDDDDGNIDRLTPTDNDGTDSDGIDTTGMLTSNDGTDSDGIDTTGAQAANDTPTPSPVSAPTPSPVSAPSPVSGSGESASS